MSDTDPAPPEAPPARKRRLLLPLLGGGAALLAAALAALWFTGVLPNMLGHRPKPPDQAARATPVYADLPDIVANLAGPAHRQSFIKLKAKLLLASPADQQAVTANMPRLLDLFLTYLRDMRPEELRGAAGTYRLREELMARASIILAPVQPKDVLFVEMLIQ